MMSQKFVETAFPLRALVRRPRHRSRLVGLVALLALSACSSGAGAPQPQAQPIVPASVAPLLVVDVGSLSVEEQLTFAALEGIVNRDTPTLYLVGLRSAQDFDIDPSAEAWLKDAVNLPTERVMPDEALRRLLPRTKGLVVWDPAVPYESQDVATTIAGMDDLVPVSPAGADRLASSFGAVVKRDLRDLHITGGHELIEWAIDNLHPATPSRSRSGPAAPATASRSSPGFAIGR